MRKSIWLPVVLVCLLLLVSCAKEPGVAPDSRPSVGEADMGAHDAPAEPDAPESEGGPGELLQDGDEAGDEPGGHLDDLDGGSDSEAPEDEMGDSAPPDNGQDGMQMEDIPETSQPPVPIVLTPVASGKVVYGNDVVSIDASHTADGYVMIRYAEESGARIKTLITFPDGTTYQYNLTPAAAYAAFPLSGGSGTYSVGVYKNVEGTKYTTLYTVDIYAEIADAFAPFLQPNQYVNYSAESEAVLLAAELSTGLTDELDIVAAIYQYIITNITYDFDKAASVKSGYLPDVDAVLASGKGICFDYAALMTAMLRSRGIPTKLAVGYTGEIYHAWISVYTEESGWIDGVIFFDGTVWKLMDPTFASSGNASEEIMAYIENPANYAAKYLY